MPARFARQSKRCSLVKACKVGNKVSPRRRRQVISFARIRVVQTKLSYFCLLIDIPRHDGEIDHLIERDTIAGFAMVLVGIWPLAPRNNAKAPRSLFVGSSTMEMER
jgi:hypothetical protein